jgi:hypothetical protein
MKVGHVLNLIQYSILFKIIRYTRYKESIINIISIYLVTKYSGCQPSAKQYKLIETFRRMVSYKFFSYSCLSVRGYNDYLLFLGHVNNISQLRLETRLNIVNFQLQSQRFFRVRPNEAKSVISAMSEA